MSYLFNVALKKENLQKLVSSHLVHILLMPPFARYLADLDSLQLLLSWCQWGGAWAGWHMMLVAQQADVLLVLQSKQEACLVGGGGPSTFRACRGIKVSHKRPESCQTDRPLRGRRQTLSSLWHVWQRKASSVWPGVSGEGKKKHCHSFCGHNLTLKNIVKQD